MDEQEQRIRHRADQIWASLRDRRADIERIADHGPRTAEDVLLVQMVFCAVMAELQARAADLI